ncbi:MAG: carbon-nitrogen hydrolase family protein [Pseudomonadales bacterium]
MSLPRIAALQMVSTNSIDENLVVAERLIAEAAKAGATLVVLPETFALFGAHVQQTLGQQEATGHAVVRPFICEQAKRWKIWIVAGTIPVAPTPATPCPKEKPLTTTAASERVFSSCFVVNDKGEECARYDKMHMFDVEVADQQGRYRESDTFLAGDHVVVVDTPVGRLGLAVCYDIRFPELFRVMFSRGVDLIAVPSAFTLLTGEAHWLPLLRARAIENQCYIIGANQGGAHSSSRSTSGGSAIIDGWGNVLAEAARGEACIVAEINLDKQSQQRRAMPINQHLRFTVLSKETSKQ